jgi:CheY-like chemotaxis protein
MIRPDRRPTILVIDDESFIRRLVRRALEPEMACGKRSAEARGASGRTAGVGRRGAMSLVEAANTLTKSVAASC